MVRCSTAQDLTIPHELQLVSITRWLWVASCRSCFHYSEARSTTVNSDFSNYFSSTDSSCVVSKTWSSFFLSKLHKALSLQRQPYSWWAYQNWPNIKTRRHIPGKIGTVLGNLGRAKFPIIQERHYLEEGRNIISKISKKNKITPFNRKLYIAQMLREKNLGKLFLNSEMAKSFDPSLHFISGCQRG